MSDNVRRPGTGNIIFVVWTMALCAWLGRYLPPGPSGDASLVAIVWTAFYHWAVNRGVPVHRYWLALAVGVLLVGLLHWISPAVPQPIRAVTTAAILVVSGAMSALGRLRKARPK